jgi:hypothetical protein
LKKDLNFSNLRESYFQAVSNFSWANEGYLVAVEIDTDKEFMEPIKMAEYRREDCCRLLHGCTSPTLPPGVLRTLLTEEPFVLVMVPEGIIQCHPISTVLLHWNLTAVLLSLSA